MSKLASFVQISKPEVPQASRMQNACRMGGMAALQIRDMPPDAVETLKRRARVRHMSLSSYLRELLLREAGRKSMDEVLAEAPGMQGPPLTNEEIRALIEEGRR
jgi:hypothetical protein